MNWFSIDLHRSFSQLNKLAGAFITITLKWIFSSFYHHSMINEQEVCWCRMRHTTEKDLCLRVFVWKKFIWCGQDLTDIPGHVIHIVSFTEHTLKNFTKKEKKRNEKKSKGKKRTTSKIIIFIMIVFVVRSLCMWHIVLKSLGLGQYKLNSYSLCFSIIYNEWHNMCVACDEI